MKISEMNECIEKMRECYNFNDDETEIILNILKKRMSPSDIKKIDMIKNLTQVISRSSKK